MLDPLRQRYAERPFLRVKETASILRIARQTLYEWWREGRGPPVLRPSPKVVRIPTDQFFDWLEARKEDA